MGSNQADYVRMDTLLHHLSTFLTVFSTEKVQTGNRVIDNSLVAILTLIIIEALRYFFSNWRSFYNRIIFVIYKMSSKPMEMYKAPYSIQLRLPITNAQFMNDYVADYICWSLSQKINNIRLEEKEITKLLHPMIEANNSVPMLGGGYLLNGATNYSEHKGSIKNMRSGIYPIAIDSKGDMIYWGTDGHMYYKSVDSYIPIKKSILYYLKVEYEKSKEKKENQDEIYTVSLDDGDVEKKSIGKISKKKTFDSLFYSQKDELMGILEKFKTKTMYPEHIPMDNKLGILLYGPPGTGKTGTISAIANYLGRSITVINFSVINTCKQLDSIMDPEKIKDTIYVFDEFDCILDVIGGEKSKETHETDWGTLLFAAEGEERKNIMKMMKEGKKPSVDATIDMAYLLQKLDGLESAEDRIIIATTNHPERINPALLRPGRFDMKLCLGHCTKEMYGKILENFYQKEKEVYSTVMAKDIPEGKYSPLQLMNLAMKHPTLESLLQVLK